MKLIIRNKRNNTVLAKLTIAYSQNPFVAVTNWCSNMGRKLYEVTWEPAL